MKCPRCNAREKQVKNGKTQAGSQVYRCKKCGRKYTPHPKKHGYSKEVRQMALRLVLDGNSQRQAARLVGVSHGTVANWFKEYADSLPEQLPVPEGPIETAEQDELFTFVGRKKTQSTS